MTEDEMVIWHHRLDKHEFERDALSGAGVARRGLAEARPTGTGSRGSQRGA